MRRIATRIQYLMLALVCALSLGVIAPATASAATAPPPGSVPVTPADGTPRTDHKFEVPPTQTSTKGVRAQLAPSQAPVTQAANVQVTVVTVQLADQKAAATAAIDVQKVDDAVASASTYWQTMSNGRLSLNISGHSLGFKSSATSSQPYFDIMDTITRELNWTSAPNTALVLVIPSDDLGGGTLGAGWSDSSSSGRVILPKPSDFTNNVLAHEFGHVWGLMHAGSLQCMSGASDVGASPTGGYADSSCSIREYGDSLDLMGVAQYELPTISSSLWDFGGFGRGDEIRNAGVATGTASYTLKAWAGTDPNRAVKFTDPISGEVYYLELRLPVGYDRNVAKGGNRGVKIVQSGGLTVASSLELMPNTQPFSGYYATNQTWQAGSTFTTYTGTRVYINWISGSAAGITISAKPPLPIGSLDSVNVVRSGGKASLQVSGWTLDRADPSVSIPAHIYIQKPDGSRPGYAVTANGDRPDVEAAYGRGPAHGFSQSFDISSPGSYRVCAYGIGLNGNPELGCQTLNVVGDPSPIGSVDSAAFTAEGGQGFITTQGWAFDPSASAPSTSVHVYVTSPDGTTTDTPFSADQPRNDVDAAYSITGQHGFAAKIPIAVAGNYRVCVYGIAIAPFSNGNALIECKNVAALAGPAPRGWLDSVTLKNSAGSAAISASGWVLDMGAKGISAPVHVYVTSPDGTTRGYPFESTVMRSDVNTFLGATGNHGFSVDIPITVSGNYRVCAYAIGSATFGAGNTSLGCMNLSAPQDMPAIGWLDSVKVSNSVNGDTATVLGWAAERQQPLQSIPVHTYVTYPDGTRLGYATAASLPRPDVLRVLGIPGDHGYSYVVALSQHGQYQVCTYAIGIPPLSPGNPELGCISFSH